MAFVATPVGWLGRRAGLGRPAVGGAPAAAGRPAAAGAPRRVRPTAMASGTQAPEAKGAVAEAEPEVTMTVLFDEEGANELDAMEADILRTLALPEKSIDSKYLFDDQGSGTYTLFLRHTGGGQGGQRPTAIAAAGWWEG